MDSQTQTIIQRKPWVLVSVLKESTREEDLKNITPQISQLIDEWHSQGKIMLSGGFDDGKTGMAVFEATDDEAENFVAKYGDVCNGILDYYIYQWDAMPILSILSKK